MDLKELHNLLNCGLKVGVATRDAKLFPEISDAMGVALSEDGKTMVVYVTREDSSQALQNIDHNGQIAVSVARPCNYFAAQIKGRVTAVRAITPEEKEHALECGEKYRKEIQLIGVTAQAAQGLKWNPDLALEAEVADLFIQTPGPVAGRRMEKE